MQKTKRRDFLKASVSIAVAIGTDTYVGRLSGENEGRIANCYATGSVSGDATYTLDDRALLAEFCAKALDSDPIKAMRVD